MQVKKMLSLLFSLCLLLGLLSTTAYANDGSGTPALACSCHSHNDGCGAISYVESTDPADGYVPAKEEINCPNAGCDGTEDGHVAHENAAEEIMGKKAVVNEASCTYVHTEGCPLYQAAYIAEIVETGLQYVQLDAAVDAAADGQTVRLLADCSTAGLELSKNLTIQGSGTETVTFSEEGIALWGKTLTFKGCTVYMNGIGSTPYTTEWNWMAVCASRGSVLNLEEAVMTMDGAGAGEAHAIYFCGDDKLNLQDSVLTIRNYTEDALEWDGGNGGYNINLCKSTFISDHNRSGFTGTFVVKAENSQIRVCNSTGNGSNGSNFDIQEGSQVEFSGNGAHGLSAGWLKVDASTVTATGNGANGVHTNSAMTLQNGAQVKITGNRCTISSKWTIPAALHLGGGDSTVDADSSLTVEKNQGSGILLKKGTLTVEPGAALTVTDNQAALLKRGGGVYVMAGEMSLPEGTVLYNNHAEEMGDDIYSAGSLRFGKTGSGWVLDDCGDGITGWFYDGLQDGAEAPRWNVDGCVSGREPYYVEYSADGAANRDALALKAAHPYIPPYVPPIYSSYTVTVQYLEKESGIQLQESFVSLAAA